MWDVCLECSHEHPSAPLALGVTLPLRYGYFIALGFSLGFALVQHHAVAYKHMYVSRCISNGLFA